MIYNKTIKFFISSTFKDFEQERNILQKFVFPKLKELCHKNGFGFQPIDLRWGIQEEAGLDQQTMNICLNEIKRSSYQPKPNLLLLVGQRYGWVPLPYEINEDEFNKIIESSELTSEEKNLITKWYEKDENAKDTVYFLKDKYTVDRDIWNKIEEQIRDVFQKISLKDSIYHKSAIEQEMYQGLDAFDKTKNHEHTFAYFRTINNYDIENEDIEDYIDIKKINGKRVLNLDNIENLSKKLQVNSNIPEKNQIKQENIKWNEIDKSKNISYENLTLENIPSYLKEFYDEILEKFTISIQTVITEFKKDTQLQIELELQENFLKDKSQMVLGRVDEIDRILEFIKDDSQQYYLQYGKSGSGKTSVIAKTISVLKEKDTEYDIYYRFIGTTANSTYSRVLFENIYWEIESRLQNNKKLLKPTMETEEKEFKKQFKSQLSKLQNKKTIIFLDALDQFEDYNDLTILLDELPSNIKVICSTLYNEKKENLDYSQYYKRLDYLENKYELHVLGKDTNETILKQWLGLKNRELISSQWNYIKPFIQDITPLHLKLIFEIIKHWKSEQKEYYLESSQEKLIIQFFNFVQKQYHHEEKLLKQTLGYISASKDGLSEEELLDLLSRDKDFLEIFQNDKYPRLSRLPNAIWSRFYFYIEPFFTEKLIDGEMLIKPYHRIIEEVVKDTYYKKNKMHFHKNLSSYFYSHQEKTKSWEERYYSLRMLSELPYQLYYSKNSDKLKEILFDLEFAGSIYNNGKQNSFRDIMSKASNLEGINEHEAYPWESFYREKEHLILKVNDELWKPYQSLFQLAYEDGLNSPLTDKANKILIDNKVSFNWIKRINIIKKYTRIGLVRVVSEYKEIIKGVIQIKNKNLLSWTNNSIINRDIKGNLLSKIKIENKIISTVCELRNEKILILCYTSDSDPFDIKYSLLVYEPINNKYNLFNEFDNHHDKVLELKDQKVLSWSSDILFRNNYYLKIYDLKKKLTTCLKGHTDNVEGVNELENGNLLTWSSDKTIKIWNKKGQCLLTLEGHSDNIIGVLELSNNEILSWSYDNTLRKWDNNEFCKIIFDDKSRTISAAIKLNNSNIVTYSFYGQIEIFNAEFNLIDYFNDVEPIFSNSYAKNILEIGNNNIGYQLGNKLKLMDLNNGSEINLEEHFNEINNFYELKNGNIISYSDESIISWDIKKNKIHEMFGHKTKVKGVLELYNGEILSWANDSDFRIWNPNYAIRYDIPEHSGSINNVLVLRNGNILSYGDDNDIVIWNKDLTINTLLLGGHSEKVDGVYELTDGRILTWSKDETLILWNSFKEKKEVIFYDKDIIVNIGKSQVLSGHKGKISNVLELSNGNILSCSYDKTLIIWDKYGKIVKKLIGHKGSVTGVVQLKNGDILSWSNDIIECDSNLRLWDNNGNLKVILQGHTAQINRVYELQNGYIITSSYDQTLKVWNNMGKLKITLKGHEGFISGLKELKDNKLLSWSKDFTIRLWDLKKRKVVIFNGHTSPITNVITLDNGDILSSSEDGTINIWNNTGYLKTSLKKHTDIIFNIIELDNRIISYSKDKTLIFWYKDYTIESKFFFPLDSFKIFGYQNGILVGDNSFLKSYDLIKR